MPGLAVLAIVILAVSGEEPLHDSADGVLLPLDKQMNVIRHQAIGVKMERQFGLLMRELNKELLIIVIRPEDELAVIAPSDDVIEPALNFESRLAHRERLYH